MKQLNFLRCLFAILILIFASCTKDVLDPVEFSYSKTKTEIKWTAYKFSNKIGVSGVFDEYIISGIGYKQAPIREMLSNLKIDITTESLNTQSEYRDNNILNSFFRKLENHERILGEVKQVTGHDTEGTLSILVDFNNVSNLIEFKYEIVDRELILQADIDLTDWKASRLLNNFTDCCEQYHTGEDGKHIIWPNIHLNIRTGMHISN